VQREGEAGGVAGGLDLLVPSTDGPLTTILGQTGRVSGWRYGGTVGVLSG